MSDVYGTLGMIQIVLRKHSLINHGDTKQGLSNSRPLRVRDWKFTFKEFCSQQDFRIEAFVFQIADVSLVSSLCKK